MKHRILIIDDEAVFLESAKTAFSRYDIDGVGDAGSARAILKENHYSLILLDLRLEQDSDALTGLDLLPELREISPNTPVIVVTADMGTDTVVKAMQQGASDFLRKNEFDLLSWYNKFELIIQNNMLNQRIKVIEEDRYPFIGNSPAVNEIKGTLRLLSGQPQITVLITGETGTGKEVAARYIHRCGSRERQPFIPVQLTSIQPNLLESELFGHRKGSFTGANYERAGYFKTADHGILFLDEIGEIPLDLQVKLLRFLETKTIRMVGDDKETPLDLQIIAATNNDLKALVEKGEFRSDLYYRIKSFQVEIPPLRLRRDDIGSLLNYYLLKNGAPRGLEHLRQDALALLAGYDWPGNVRELRNAIEFAWLKAKLQHSNIILPAFLPVEISSETDLQPDYTQGVNKPVGPDVSISRQIADLELKKIDAALRLHWGRKDNAASSIGLTPDQMRYRVKKYLKLFPDIGSSYASIMRFYH